MSDSMDTLAKQAKEIQATTNELLGRFEKLSTFEEAARWDADALAVIHLFEQYRTTLHEQRLCEETAFTQAKAAREALPVAKRLLASKSPEKLHQEAIVTLERGIESIDKAMSNLHDYVDRTPASKAEQQEIISELKLLKNELSTEKRSVSASMQTIRTNARQNATGWSGVSGGTLGSITRYQRTAIRREKESALRPHEDAKARLERQLIDIERRIAWVSRFKGEDPPPEDHISRCAYCGRRTNPGEPCRGCGSDATTRDLSKSIHRSET